jgi:hypothetical protein
MNRFATRIRSEVRPTLLKSRGWLHQEEQDQRGDMSRPHARYPGEDETPPAEGLERRVDVGE